MVLFIEYDLFTSQTTKYKDNQIRWLGVKVFFFVSHTRKKYGN